MSSFNFNKKAFLMILRVPLSGYEPGISLQVFSRSFLINLKIKRNGAKRLFYYKNSFYSRLSAAKWLMDLEIRLVVPNLSCLITLKCQLIKTLSFINRPNLRSRLYGKI